MRLPQGERYRITEKSACAKTTRRRPKRQILKQGNHVRRLICGRYRHHESAVRTLARGARHRVRPAASRGPAGLDMTFTPQRPAVKPHARNRAGPGGERPCRRRGPRRTSGLNAGLERTATPGTRKRSPIAAAVPSDAATRASPAAPGSAFSACRARWRGDIESGLSHAWRSCWGRIRAPAGMM